LVIQCLKKVLLVKAGSGTPNSKLLAQAALLRIHTSRQPQGRKNTGA